MRSLTALPLVLVVFGSEALANAGGITGRSGKQTITCSGCHTQAGAATTLTVTGPLTVTAGARSLYTIDLAGGPGAWGGTNVAADVGVLGNQNGTLRVTAGELTHSDKRMFSAGSVSWPFYWTAPTTPGPAKIWVAAQSTDGNGQTTNDREALKLLNITVIPANQPPTVATAAAATPATVAATTTTLTATGADDGGPAALLYTWSLVTGPAAVTFSANGTNAAKTTTATFTRAGAYSFNVRIADAPGLVVNSTVNVTVSQTYTALKVTPATKTLALGSQQIFAAGAFDQFNQTMTTPGTVAWTASAGTIAANGLYTTPAAVGGPHTLTATATGKSGTAAVTVVSGAPPTIATAAASLVLTNQTVRLTVLGSDDGGEALLKYTWAATAGPGTPAFSANATNAAKSTVATLTRAGLYTFTATVTDRAGLTTTSTVNVTVDAEYTALRVTPVTVTVKPMMTAQLTATALDQFARQMTMPGTVSWVSFGGGSVSSSGEYVAGSTLGGPFQVRATVSGKTATTDVTVANDGLPVVLGLPTASPAAVLGRTTRLRVVADDEAGETGLTYRWEATGPAPVAFAPNGTNAAQQSTATFEQAGTYTITITVTNAAGKSASADVPVDVLASPDRVKVTPDAVTVRANGMQAFSAALLDQFADEVPGSPAIEWSTPNAGQIDSTGMLRALGTPGRYTVTATVNGLRGQAQVTVDGVAPTVSLVSPIALAQLKGDVSLTAAVSDDDVLAEVRFYVDDALIGIATMPPFEVSWDTKTVTDESHELYVVAEDVAGNSTKTQPIQVQVWNDETRPPPGPAVAQGGGCSATGASTVGPLILLIAVLAVLRGRRSGVPSTRHLQGDTRLIPAHNPAQLRRNDAGTPAATRHDRRRPSMSRTTLVAALLTTAVASAQTLTVEQRERCATRLSINVLGQSPSAALLAATDPRNEVPNLLQSSVFVDRFAAFIQERFSPEPNRYAAQDTPYYLTRKILTEGKPWKDLFVGPYVFTREATDINGTMPPIITEDPAGYGYTQSADWRRRYQGNELQGYRLVHAYRLINNALGMELKAALNTDGISADGRKASTCSGCHYHPVFGLDLIARVLPLRGRTVPADVPQTLLGGKVISTEKELLTALVDSPDFKFNVCRTAMRYAYGRAEYKCEGPVFDACMTAFTATPTMQAALSAVLRHSTYCQ